MLERAKSSILPNGNFREFFLWRGGICVFKTGIPGDRAVRVLVAYPYTITRVVNLSENLIFPEISGNFRKY